MSTPQQLAEARRRLDLVEALGRFPSLRRASEALGEPLANLSRYRRLYDPALGLQSLLPGTDRAGRPAAAEALSADEIAEARRWLLKTESLPLALEYLADGPACSHATRELLERYRERRDYPPSIVRAIRFTEEEWAAFRGRKAAQGTAYTVRRGMEVVEADGARRQLFAGDLVEADDVSTDVPYFVTLPDGQVRIGRQILVFRDVRSRKYLYAAAIARAQDSYRAEDIVRSCRWLVEAHGLPGRFRFERGSWASDAIDGHPLADGTRWGGIAQLVPVEHAYSSNGKTIEGGFRLMHQVMGAQGVRIGKTRGEYEQPTADMLAVHAGRKDPAACGFIPWERVLKAIEDTFTKINGRATYDRHTGAHTTPDDLWAADMQARPGKRLPVCPPEFFDHFLPVKRLVSVGAVQAGHVQVSLPDHAAPFVFRCAGPDAATGAEIPYLERLHKVWVCFDPHTAAATGAVIYNAEPADASRNRGGYRPQERLFTAPLAADRPQLDLRPAAQRGPDADVAAKKVRATQIRAAGTSIGVFGQGARRVRHQSDAQGNVATMESGAPARSQAPRTDEARQREDGRSEWSGPEAQRRGDIDRAPAPGGQNRNPAPVLHSPRTARAVAYEDLDAAPARESAPARQSIGHWSLDIGHSASRAPASASRAASPAIHYEDI